MLIGERIRAIREARKLSQEDIERLSNLKSSYISRVENEHTVPSVETLEKLARALHITLYQLFYEREQPPKSPRLALKRMPKEIVWGASGKQIRFWKKLRGFIARMKEYDRQLLLRMALKMAKR